MKKTLVKLGLLLGSIAGIAANAQSIETENSAVSNPGQEFEQVMYSHPLISETTNQEFKFNLNYYQGKWFEQARLPNFFQKKCASSTAEYTLQDSGKVNVVNTCYEFDGKVNDIVGKAKVYNKDPSGRSLVVSFNWINDIINFFSGTNYYVYFVDEFYNYAIVGTPKKDLLWILSREEHVSDVNMNLLLEKAVDYGFDVTNIIYDQR